MTHSDKVHMRQMARDRAYIDQWYDIYRHKMRYNTEEVVEELNLDDRDIHEIKLLYQRQEANEMDYRYVVVGFPVEDFYQDPEWYHKRAEKAMKKIYVGLYYYTLEEYNKKGENHPHYNFYFKKTVKWLAKSRIIDEFSSTFKVAKNYVNVDEKNKYATSKILSYMQKEDGSILYTNDKKFKK